MVTQGLIKSLSCPLGWAQACICLASASQQAEEAWATIAWLHCFTFLEVSLEFRCSACDISNFQESPTGRKSCPILEEGIENGITR